MSMGVTCSWKVDEDFPSSIRKKVPNKFPTNTYFPGTTISSFL